LLQSHIAELHGRYGVRRLSLFGSVARDEAGPVSDVDVLVDFGQPPSFRQYMGTKFYLEDLFGCKVDLVTQGTLKPRAVPYVERESITVVHGT
jgi:predicted nucleotidyltransferase